MELKNKELLIKALLNYEDYFYCGTQELNNAHSSFAKLHRLIMWNSIMKRCSSKLCLKCIDFYCGTLELNNAHQNFAKFHILLMLNSRIKQPSCKLFLNCIHFYCETQELNNARQSFAKLQRLLLLWNSRTKHWSSMLC